MYYKKYRENGLVYPKIIIKESNLYKDRLEPYKNFIDDYLDKTDKKNDEISIKAMQQAMRNWYKSNYYGECPGIKKMREYLQENVDAYDAENDSLTYHKIRTNTELLDELENTY